MAGKTLADIDVIDLYSCFASAVQIGCRRDRPGRGRPARADHHRRAAVLRRPRQQLRDAFDQRDAAPAACAARRLRPGHGQRQLRDQTFLRRVFDRRRRPGRGGATARRCCRRGWTRCRRRRSPKRRRAKRRIETYTVMHGKAGPEFAVVFGRLERHRPALHRQPAGRPGGPVGPAESRQPRPARPGDAGGWSQHLHTPLKTGDDSMYPGKYATQHPDRPAFIMASTGEAVSYREFEARSNRLAHLLRAHGPAAAGPLRHVPGEQQPLPRKLLGRLPRRAVLHLHQQLPDGRGAGLHRQQQRIEAADHVARQAGGGGRGAEVVPAGQAVPGGGWRRRAAAAVPGLRHRHRRLSGHADRRRMAGHVDAVFVGHDRPAQGHPAAAARRPADRGAADLRLPAEAVALPRGHGLPVAGTAVPLGAECRGVA